ncbi:LacI family DNA-binding transcriptional regulator [Eubacteriales bacterium mix99]
MITIEKVAKQCELSKSTVSRYITGKGYVSKKSGQKIEQAIQELGYIPNQIARDFRSGSTKNIGFISNGYFDQFGTFLNHFLNEALKYGYFVTSYLTDGNQEKEIECLDLLKQKKLDGVFILIKSNDWGTIKPYCKYGPIATWHKLNCPEIYSCSVDHYECYLHSLNYLYHHCHKTKIAHVIGYQENNNTQRRLKAIKFFYHQHPDLVLNKEWLLISKYQQIGGREIARLWTASSKEERPDAIIFHEDFLAGEFISELRYMNYRIPEDVNVIGCDNSTIGQLMNMSTIDYSLDRQAQNSFRYLYNQLNGTNLPYFPITVRLLPRQTTT